MCIGSDGAAYPTSKDTWKLLGLDVAKSLVVNEGTVVVFQWTSYLGVSTVPTEDDWIRCLKQGAEEVVAPATEGRLEWDTAGMGGTTVYFVCPVADHCDYGARLKLQIRTTLSSKTCSRATKRRACRRRRRCRWSGSKCLG